MLDHRVEDPSDGIHGELVPVTDDKPTDWPIETLDMTCGPSGQESD